MLTSDLLLKGDPLLLIGKLLSSSAPTTPPVTHLYLSPLYVHLPLCSFCHCLSFILEARCEYFRIMFSSGMTESNAVNEESAPAMVDIVVPDSFVGLLRFLIYLYTDILPDGSDGALLEDLMSADRYQVSSLTSWLADETSL
jgi:hypothetical protein